MTQTPIRADAPRDVLVVDDHDDAAESLATLLVMQGHRVRVAHTGPEALVAARERRPDVVLLDIGLPGMDGYAVARALRGLPGGDACLVVALTGRSDVQGEVSTSGGFDQHLLKPIDPATLHEVVVTRRAVRDAESA